MRRLLSLILAVGFFLLVFVGCGKGAINKTDSADEYNCTLFQNPYFAFDGSSYYFLDEWNNTVYKITNDKSGEIEKLKELNLYDFHPPHWLFYVNNHLLYFTQIGQRMDCYSYDLKSGTEIALGVVEDDFYPAWRCGDVLYTSYKESIVGIDLSKSCNTGELISETIQSPEEIFEDKRLAGIFGEHIYYVDESIRGIEQDDIMYELKRMRIGTSDEETLCLYKGFEINTSLENGALGYYKDAILFYDWEDDSLCSLNIETGEVYQYPLTNKEFRRLGEVDKIVITKDAFYYFRYTDTWSECELCKYSISTGESEAIAALPGSNYSINHAGECLLLHSNNGHYYLADLNESELSLVELKTEH